MCTSARKHKRRWIHFLSWTNQAYKLHQPRVAVFLSDRCPSLVGLSTPSRPLRPAPVEGERGGGRRWRRSARERLRVGVLASMMRMGGQPSSEPTVRTRRTDPIIGDLEGLEEDSTVRQGRAHIFRCLQPALPKLGEIEIEMKSRLPSPPFGSDGPTPYLAIGRS